MIISILSKNQWLLGISFICSILLFTFGSTVINVEPLFTNKSSSIQQLFLNIAIIYRSFDCLKLVMLFERSVVSIRLFILGLMSLRIIIFIMRVTLLRLLLLLYVICKKGNYNVDIHCQHVWRYLLKIMDNPQKLLESDVKIVCPVEEMNLWVE